MWFVDCTLWPAAFAGGTSAKAFRSAFPGAKVMLADLEERGPWNGLLIYEYSQRHTFLLLYKT